MDSISSPQIITKQGLDSGALSFVQQRLWFLDQLNSGNPAHNISRAIHLKGSLDVKALEQSLGEIVQRHQAMRTIFTAVDGQPLQVIASSSNWMMPIVDLSKLSVTELQQESQHLLTESAQQPFDLATGPLVRATLQRLGEIEHILLLTIHEIVCDNWSLNILLQELASLYEAFSNGLPSPLVELPIQYTDFAIWQREWLQSEVLESHLGYWKQQLGGELPVLELPTDHLRPPVQTYRGARQSLNLPKDLTNALKSLSQQSGVTLLTTMLAAFNILLYRYTAQEDIIVGSPIPNRNQHQVEGLIGLFANNLVMRTNLSGNPSFRELLGRVQEVVLSAYSHQDLPFEKLVEELQTKQDFSRSLLFQVTFALQSQQVSALEFPGLSLNAIEVESKTAKFDLTLEAQESSEGINGWFEYNADLFDADTISRMIGNWQVLLEGVVAQPNQQISHLPILTEAEKHQLLVEWNDIEADYPKNVCLHQLVERQVEKTPDAVAIIFENQQLTYKELNCRANQFAHYLQAMGVKPQTPVAIFTELCMDVAVGILGITKAGGVLLPLDLKYPKERLAFILEETQAPVLLTQQRLLTELPPYQGDIVCLDTSWQTITQQSLENPDTEVKPENLAYILYTSGSTGKPKGVMLSHFVCCNRELWEQRTYPMTTKDRILLKSAWSSKEFFWPLLAGATAVMTRPGGYQDTNYLVNLIAEQKITVISVVPTVLKLMLEELNIENCRNLRHIFCVGEAMPVQLQDSFFKKGLAANLYNLYGLNEVNYATVWQCQSNDEQHFVPIGRPTDMQIYLLDQYLQPVPTGVMGEICISGVGLASGYFNRPDLTEEKFIPNPFSEELGARLYKTGDLARYLPDGVIQYIGRIDHQVKIRGNRIELGEVEAVLRQHPSVKISAVIAKEEVPGNKRLVAYFTPNPEQTIKVEQLRRFLQQKLPDYMVPSNFVLLEVMPLTFNGKIDRLALASLESPQTSLKRTFVAPRTPVEQRLTDIWMQVLKLKSVSIHDNFFELGVNSLSLTQVMHRVYKAFQIKLTLRDLYEIPTIAELAERVEILCWQVGNSSEDSYSKREEIIL
ncbi:non-ribosomal peptide synthetase [Nostoc sp. UIC 10890]